MGTTLTGNKVKDTYKSLIKITDSTEAGSSAKQLSDGDGNDLGLYVDTDGVFGIGAPANVSLDISSATDAIGLPVGTTANRPTGSAGQMRYNSTTGDFELYDTGWTEIFTTDGGTVSGDVTITGDLIVQGTTVTLNTETIEFEDNILQLNTTQGTPDTATGVVSGISIYRGDGVTQASFLFDDADDTWDLTNNLVVDGSTTVSYLSLGSIETTPSDSAFVYRPTNSSIAMGAAGSEIMRLTAGSGATFTGNFAITSSDFSVNTDDFFVDASSSYVAIGHVNPLYPLHIINSNGNIFKASTSDTIVNMFLENNTQRVDLYSNRGAAAIQVDQNDDSGAYDSTFAITIDNNRYLYINTAGDVLLEGGDLIVDTDTLYVDSADNRLGIGTNDPLSLLHIKSAFTEANSASQFRIQNTTTGESAVMAFEAVAANGSTGNQGSITFSAGVSASLSDNVLAFNAENQLSAGSPDMVILGNGNVGIGIASPANTLEVNSGAFTDIAKIGNNNGSFTFGYSTSLASIDLAASKAFRIRQGTVVPFYISTSGNVGIGTDSPAANLDILNGITGASLKLSATTTAYWQIQRNSTTGNLNISDDALGNVMSFDQLTGNVGIGTDSPSGELHILNSTGDADLWVESTSTNGDARLNLYANSGGVSQIRFGDESDTNVGLLTYEHSDNSMQFRVNDAERMRIDSAGVVKIFSTGGTSEKTYTALAGLQLYSQQSDAGSPYTKTSDIVANGDGTVPSELRMFTKSNGSSAPTERLRIDSSGRVGIGMTPSNYSGYMLQVNGGTQSFMSFGNSATGTGALNGLVIGNDSTGADIYQREEQPLRFHTNSTERMRIDSSGIVTGTITDDSFSDVDQLILKRVWSTSSSNDRSHGIAFKDANSTMARIYADRVNSASNYASHLVFITNDGTTGTDTSEKMRITSGGEILFGTETASTTHAYFSPASDNRMVLKLGTSTTSGTGVAVFQNPNGTVGSIRTSGTSTAFNTSGSDLRLKKNIEDWNENVLDSFASIQPKEFHFNVQDDNEEKVKGYIAQDNVDKFPEAYPQDEDGFYSYNPSGMVVYLMKAIQELKAEIETLKSQIQ